MAKLYNLARMTTATTGTGTITLGAAVSGFLTFAGAGVANGETVSYGISDGANSEVGTGVYTASGTTLTRIPTTSTNSNAAISLSGTAQVYVTERAEDLDLERARQNRFLDWIYQSKLFGGVRRLVNAWADGYKASDGINAGSSSGYTLDTTNGKVSPTYSATTVTIDAAATTANIAGYTMVARDVAVLNSQTVQSIGVYSTAPNATFKLKLVKRNSANNYDVVVVQSVSHPGGGWQDFLLSTPYAVPGTGSYYLAAYQTLTPTDVTALSGVARAYFAGDLAGTGQTTNGEDTAGDIYPLRYSYGTGFASMTLVTAAQTADGSVSNVRALIEYDNTANPTPGTDFTIEATCNGGTNWTAAASNGYAVVALNGQAGRKVVETNDIACTAGTSVEVRFKTANNKNMPLYGLAGEFH